MKFHYQTSIYAIVTLVSQACFIGAAETGATTRNIVERDLSSKQHHGQILTIDFDEITTGGPFGWYTNKHIQMENFRYWRTASDTYVVKSPPNVAFNYGDLGDYGVLGPPIMSCPGGSFDLISMCITNWNNTPDVVAMFNGKLAHDDSCGITIDEELGSSEVLKGRMTKCLNFNRGYKDLSSVDISNIYGKYREMTRIWLMFDDIKIKIHSPCDVDNQQTLNRMNKIVKVDELPFDEDGDEGDLGDAF